MTRPKKRGAIPRGEIVGKRVGGEPKSGAEHYIKCPACGAYVDMRDLGQVLEHEGSSGTGLLTAKPATKLQEHALHRVLLRGARLHCGRPGLRKLGPLPTQLGEPATMDGRQSLDIRF
jgi:hypothetical protein